VSTPGAVDPGESPIACTLGPDDGAGRMRRWKLLVETAHPVASREGGIVEVRFEPGSGVLEELSSLAAAEQECCAFVTWTVTEDQGSPVLCVLAEPDSPDDVCLHRDAVRCDLTDLDAGRNGLGQPCRWWIGVRVHLFYTPGVR